MTISSIALNVIALSAILVLIPLTIVVVQRGLLTPIAGFILIMSIIIFGGLVGDSGNKPKSSS